jgi:hypothetical protein
MKKKTARLEFRSCKILSSPLGCPKAESKCNNLLIVFFYLNVAVDLDGSGTIEFDEFLAIMLKIKRGKSTGPEQNSAIFDFFQSTLIFIIELSKGNLGEEYDKNMSFKLNVSQFRRRKILESIMSNAKDKK